MVVVVGAVANVDFYGRICGRVRSLWGYLRYRQTDQAAQGEKPTLRLSTPVNQRPQSRSVTVPEGGDGGEGNYGTLSNQARAAS